MHELRPLVLDYLQSGKLMHLATSREDQPWMAHVWYAFSPDLRLIVFTSNQVRRHSEEIKMNPQVAGGIVAIELDGLGQKVRGLSFEGEAVEAAGPDIARCYEVYAARWPQVVNMFSADEIEAGLTAMRMYAVRVRSYVLFDEVNFPDAPRQELGIG